MKKIMLYPDLNIEDLSDGDNLMRMFESRATNAPQSFFIHDLALANIAAFTHSDNPDSALEGFAMLISGGFNPKTWDSTVRRQLHVFAAEDSSLSRPCWPARSGTQILSGSENH